MHLVIEQAQPTRSRCRAIDQLVRIGLISVMASLLDGCSHETACDDIKARYTDATKAWDASHFAVASRLFEAIVPVAQRCRDPRGEMKPRAQLTIAQSWMAAAEASHQAGDSKRSADLLAKAYGAFLGLRNVHDLDDADFGDDVDEGYDQVTSDRAGVWTEHGRLE